MKNIFFLILILLFRPASGQSLIFARDIRIPITQLDSNVLWGKTVYRFLALSDDTSLYGGISVTMKGTKEQLVENIIKSVKSGRDTAYYSNKRLAPTMMDSLRVRVGRIYEMNTYFREFEYADVQSLIIIENWYYLKKEQIIRKEFVAICLRLGEVHPADPINDYNPLDFWEQGVFWIY
ncbi:MAG: hypothetical protein A2W93_03920 [Bacteroidetes bacterium GWF2_43_63]|nr:MAG: hypothetical protein A2W94_15780 [Bacteroidetes bacterium GWE2_42_42]OFY55373.1 MAG: hypothetical protein A2W93_03920 [Bacteroidetes bacterium GWF2_43_63]HBG70651.1 hypothetical protein [Bacteroidales bacterium]HCB61755.1 hypothetical protein [Bacteroidales bacterium]HCY22649.1 hypothetical protein [Bacteroidales bacterium]